MDLPACDCIQGWRTHSRALFGFEHLVLAIGSGGHRDGLAETAHSRVVYPEFGVCGGALPEARARRGYAQASAVRNASDQSIAHFISPYKTHYTVGQNLKRSTLRFRKWSKHFESTCGHGRFRLRHFQFPPVSIWSRAIGHLS